MLRRRERERESAWSDEGHSCRGQIYRRARLPGETWPRCYSGSSGCNWDRTTSATSPPTEGEISPQATHLISHTGTYSVSLAMNQIFFKLKDFYFLVTFVLSISLIMSRERYFSIEGSGLHSYTDFSKLIMIQQLLWQLTTIHCRAAVDSLNIIIDDPAESWSCLDTTPWVVQCWHRIIPTSKLWCWVMGSSLGPLQSKYESYSDVKSLKKIKI